MAGNNWADVRLSASIHPNSFGGGQSLCVDWRLSSKAPGATWDERATVAFGSEAVAGIPWPPSREDALAVLTEVLMGIRWEAPPF